MFEHRTDRLASSEVYRKRLLKGFLIGLALIVASLAIGMAGYAASEGLGVVDSFLNAAMILSGMGPVHNPTTTAGKLFAGIYALYSGFAVLGIAGVIFAPTLHRIMHRFHIEERADVGKPPAGKGDKG
jgi:hypothetical protein